MTFVELRIVPTLRSLAKAFDDRLAHTPISRWRVTKQSDSGKTRKGEPFCLALYRRIAGISIDAARCLASEIAAFAVKHNAKAFVIEDLKGWRPKGPNMNQRKRFHRFQHRMLVKHLGFKAEELGMRMIEIYARGTSRYAYDGSGKVDRSSKNAQLATFSTGKKYNADLNGALNIDRCWRMPKQRKPMQDSAKAPIL